MADLGNEQSVGFILTRDRAAAKAWYCDVLGLRLKWEDPFGTVLDMNGATLRLTEIPDHKASPHPVLGWEVNDIAATITTLVERGVVMTIYEGFGQDSLGIWTAPDGRAKVAWFNDPDGNALSLAQH